MTRMGRYRLLLSVVPLSVGMALIKGAVHFAGFEFIPREMGAYFPSILTGIIFLLGFLLAGVVADFKESEKIPNDLAASLYVVWQEATMLADGEHAAAARPLLEKCRALIPALRDALYAGTPAAVLPLIDLWTDDCAALDRRGVAPGYLIRIKNEQAALRRLLGRISVIKNTDFAPSLYVVIRLIIGIFITLYFLLVVEPWWGGVLLAWFFSFILFAIIFLIRDMEDPFDYGPRGARGDEVSLIVLDELQRAIEASRR